MQAEAILAETNSSLRSIALCGVNMALPSQAAARLTARHAARIHRRIYIYSLKRTVAFAVKGAAARLVHFPLEKLNALHQQNEAAFSQLFDLQPQSMSAHAKRDVLLQALTWTSTKEILEATIVMHPDMHLNVNT
jgi:hypothetical protein